MKIKVPGFSKENLLIIGWSVYRISSEMAVCIKEKGDHLASFEKKSSLFGYLLLIPGRSGCLFLRQSRGSTMQCCFLNSSKCESRSLWQISSDNSQKDNFHKLFFDWLVQQSNDIYLIKNSMLKAPTILVLTKLLKTSAIETSQRYKK